MSDLEPNNKSADISAHHEVKRGRGRPRKHPPVQKKSEQMVSNGDTKVPGKRGRPKKSSTINTKPSTNNETTGVKVKRGRGRPRKVENGVDVCDDKRMKTRFSESESSSVEESDE